MLKRQGYLRVKEASALLGVSPNTLRSWGAHGQVPEYRHPMNNYRLYRRNDRERIMAELRRSPTRRGNGKRTR